MKTNPTNKLALTAALCLLLLAVPASAGPDPVQEAVDSLMDECPFIQVYPYDPYYYLHPECLDYYVFGET